jgi:hypothetical protein
MTQNITTPKRYFAVPEETIFLVLGILRLESDGIKNPASNIDTALKEIKACCTHSEAMIPALNKKEKDYLIAVIRDDMEEYPAGDEILTEEMRDKLFEKIKAVKV